MVADLACKQAPSEPEQHKGAKEGGGPQFLFFAFPASFSSFCHFFIQTKEWGGGGGLVDWLLSYIPHFT